MKCLTESAQARSSVSWTLWGDIGLRRGSRECRAQTTTSTAYDTLKVQAVNSSGSTKTLATYSNLNAGSGYTARTLDLSAYMGQTVTLKFVGAEDSSLQTSFVLDDVTVIVQ